MTDTTSTHVELVEDLRRLVVGRVLNPLRHLLDSAALVDPLHERVRIDAEVWAAQLLGSDDPLAARTAGRVLAVLYPDDSPFDPPQEWWRTPLGRVVARRVGHPSEDRVSYALAGAMLGITRQGVHDLINRDKLHRHPEGGVETASVRARLNRS